MTSTNTTAISVMGAGAWGTTLAILLARNHHTVHLWGHDPSHMAALANQRRNAKYLPDIPLPQALRITPDLAEAVAAGRELLIAVPSASFSDLVEQLAPLIRPGTRVAWATKGLEARTGRLLHHVVRDRLGAVETAVISGPTFAREVAAGLPTAVTVASDSAAYAAQLARWLHNTRFRAYTSGDMIGVQLGGAVKNVLAVAAGIADGLGYGANTRAALVTRGLADSVTWC
jgi:glycerol-3-phosphate dehydrogenase (NAD(P)+)